MGTGTIAFAAENNNIGVGNYIDKTAWTDGLNPGEKVVEVYNEPIENVIQLNLVNSIRTGEIVPFEASLRWFPMTKAYVGEIGGNWLSAGASTVSGGVLTASHSNSISNSFTGNLMVTAYDLEMLVGFNINKTSTEAVGYNSQNLPKLKNKGHRLEYRHMYKKYQVKQEKKYDKRATQSYGTEYVYPMQWFERQYRVVEFNI